MNPSDEKKLLIHALRRLDSPPESLLTARWIIPVGWIVCVSAFLAAFQLGHRVDSGVLAVAFAILGVAIGVITFARICAKQEPVMRVHIDRDSIVRRLAELEA